MNRKIIFIIIMILLAITMLGCKAKKPYSSVLEEKIRRSNQTEADKRPAYLPPEMFVRLPEFPADFYKVRTLVRTGKIVDFENLSEKYWMQPEFFPNFEDIGLPILQNPPKNRWGAYGISVYPGDTVVSIKKGDTISVYFFIKSGYLVETYQGINLEIVYPKKATITSGYELPDGTKTVEQDPLEISKYFEVKVEPNPFILEPNFPIYNINGTRKIKVTLTASRNTPPGNYVIGIDTSRVPEIYEQRWIKEYLNLYVSGNMVKIDRPYYQVFLNVVE